MSKDVLDVSLANDPILLSSTDAGLTATLQVAGLTIFSTPLAPSITRVIHE